jgi:hypothetical protein
MGDFIAFKFTRPDGTTFLKAIDSDNISEEVTAIARKFGAIDAVVATPSKGDKAVRSLAETIGYGALIVAPIALGWWLTSRGH